MSPEEILDVIVRTYRVIEEGNVNFAEDVFLFRHQFLVSDMMTHLGVDMEKLRPERTYLQDERGVYHVDDTTVREMLTPGSVTCCGDKWETKKVRKVLQRTDVLCQECPEYAMLTWDYQLQDSVISVAREWFHLLRSYQELNNTKGHDDVFSFDSDVTKIYLRKMLIKTRSRSNRFGIMKSLLTPESFVVYEKTWESFFTKVKKENQEQYHYWQSDSFYHQLIQELTVHTQGLILSSFTGPQIFAFDNADYARPVINAVAASGKKVKKATLENQCDYVELSQKLSNLFYTYVTHQRETSGTGDQIWFFDGPIPAVDRELVEIALTLHQPTYSWDDLTKTPGPLNTLQGAYRAAKLTRNL